MIKTDLVLAMEKAQAAASSAEKRENEIRRRAEYMESLSEKVAEMLSVYDASRHMELFAQVAEAFEKGCPEYKCGYGSENDDDVVDILFLVPDGSEEGGIAFNGDKTIARMVNDEEAEGVVFPVVGDVREILEGFSDFGDLDAILGQISDYADKVLQAAQAIVDSVNGRQDVSAQEEEPEEAVLELPDEESTAEPAASEGDFGMQDEEEAGEEPHGEPEEAFDVDNPVDTVDNPSEEELQVTERLEPESPPVADEPVVELPDEASEQQVPVPGPVSLTHLTQPTT